MIPFFDINYDSREKEAISGVLDRRWISGGPELKAFEEEFARHTGAPYAVALSSCTSALQLALHILGLGPGDEVIVPSLTFAATANSVVQCGAKVRFAEIASYDDLTLCPSSVEELITPATKAVISMHYAGFLANMPALATLAERHNLFLIEDAAHLPGGSGFDSAVGEYSAMACYSFYSNKNISIGEGGMITTSNEAYARQARLLRGHGITTSAFERASNNAPFYTITQPGFNYRMTDLAAALGRVQLSKYESDRLHRQHLFKHYCEELEEIRDYVRVPFAAREDLSPAYHLMVVRLPEGRRQELSAYLKAQEIQTSFHYPAIHLMEYYHGAQILPITEELQDQLITLPMYGRLTKDEVHEVCRTIRRYFDHR